MHNESISASENAVEAALFGCVQGWRVVVVVVVVVALQVVSGVRYVKIEKDQMCGRPTSLLFIPLNGGRPYIREIVCLKLVATLKKRYKSLKMFSVTAFE